ncbi:Uncharacterized protein TCM_038669 [Theobroma cacao]|uniref:Uncharacterized protein n=1 Tax=Theobroma cacao TaxID=3641 RepID=A0A061GPD1_THECC|nr:Uncharacterized protein TCM_038669 [Theobroma cacao]
MSANIIETTMAVRILWSEAPRLLLRGSGSMGDYYAYLLESLVSFLTQTLLHGGELRLLYSSLYLNKAFSAYLTIMSWFMWLIILPSEILHYDCNDPSLVATGVRDLREISPSPEQALKKFLNNSLYTFTKPY